MADDLINALSGANRASSVLGAIANPAQVNVLGAFGGAAETAARMYQARDLQAQQLTGEAFQNSLNPDGTPNQAKFNQNIVAAGPNAAMRALDSSQKGLNLDTGTFALHQSRVAGVSLALSQLLADNPNGVPQDQVNKVIDDQLKAGNITPEMADEQRKVYGADPVANSRAIIQNQMRLVSAQQALENARPSTSLENTGGQLQPVARTPLASTTAQPGAVTTPAGSVPTTLTPGQKVETQPVLGPGGQKGSQPIGSRYDEFGNLKPPGWGNGKYTPPGGQPQAAAPAQNGPAGFQPTEQPPGAEAATAAGNAIYTQADAANAQKSQLLTMESDLQGISTGPVAERKQRLDALTAQLGIGPITATPDELAKGEAFAKVAKQIALAQAGALGVGTDEKLTVAMGANPSLNLSKVGNKQIIAMLQGNADAIRARGVAYDAWLKEGNNPADSNKFITGFNRTFDPRVYQWQYQIKDMSPDQRQAAFNKLPDKDAFRAKYNDAVKQGLIVPQ